MNNDQIKLISSYFKELAYAQFAFFGITGYSDKNWMVVMLSGIIFLVMAIVSIAVMSLQTKEN